MWRSLTRRTVVVDDAHHSFVPGYVQQTTTANTKPFAPKLVRRLRLPRVRAARYACWGKGRDDNAKIKRFSHVRHLLVAYIYLIFRRFLRARAPSLASITLPGIRLRRFGRAFVVAARRANIEIYARARDDVYPGGGVILDFRGRRQRALPAIERVSGFIGTNRPTTLTRNVKKEPFLLIKKTRAPIYTHTHVRL